jgi:hypothetical protein
LARLVRHQLRGPGGSVAIHWSVIPRSLSNQTAYFVCVNDHLWQERAFIFLAEASSYQSFGHQFKSHWFYRPGALTVKAPVPWQKGLIGWFSL